MRRDRASLTEVATSSWHLWAVLGRRGHLICSQSPLQRLLCGVCQGHEHIKQEGGLLPAPPSRFLKKGCVYPRASGSHLSWPASTCRDSSLSLLILLQLSSTL